MDEYRCYVCGKALYYEGGSTGIALPKPHFAYGSIRVCNDCMRRALEWLVKKYKKEVENPGQTG